MLNWAPSDPTQGRLTDDKQAASRQLAVAKGRESEGAECTESRWANGRSGHTLISYQSIFHPSASVPPSSLPPTHFLSLSVVLAMASSNHPAMVGLNQTTAGGADLVMAVCCCSDFSLTPYSILINAFTPLD